MLVYIVGLELEIEYFENLNKVKDFKKIVRFYWMILKQELLDLLNFVKFEFR